MEHVGNILDRFSILFWPSARYFIMAFGMLFILVPGAREYFVLWRIVLLWSSAIILFWPLAIESILASGAQFYFGYRRS